MVCSPLPVADDNHALSIFPYQVAREPLETRLLDWNFKDGPFSTDGTAREPFCSYCAAFSTGKNAREPFCSFCVVVFTGRTVLSGSATGI